MTRLNIQFINTEEENQQISTFVNLEEVIFLSFLLKTWRKQWLDYLN